MNKEFDARNMLKKFGSRQRNLEKFIEYPCDTILEDSTISRLIGDR